MGAVAKAGKRPNVNAQEGNIILKLVVELLETGHLRPARRAEGGPVIQDQGFTVKAG